MDLFAPLLGKHTTDVLQSRPSQVFLTIGRDTFTKGQFNRIECLTYDQQHALEKALKDLAATSVQDVFDRITPAQLADYKGVGPFSFAVLGGAFQIMKVGTLKAWRAKHRDPDAKKKDITVASMKARSRDAQADKAERKQRKDRKGRRRDKAQQLRTERLARRTGQTL